MLKVRSFSNLSKHISLFQRNVFKARYCQILSKESELLEEVKSIKKSVNELEIKIDKLLVKGPAIGDIYCAAFIVMCCVFIYSNFLRDEVEEINHRVKNLTRKNI